MKQAFQSLKNGNIELVELPVPKLDKNSLLIKSKLSLISSGTEKMLLDFGKSNFIEKAINNKDRVKEVIDKMKIEGPVSVYNKIMTKLEQPIPIGYCNLGTVIGIGDEVSGFKLGDRVISNGPHAEIVTVNKNLCSKVPENVEDEDAVYTVISSVALHSIRISSPEIGETYLVVGLGLVGLIVTKLLMINGCNVVCADLDLRRLKIAKQMGAKVINVNDFNSLQEGILAAGLDEDIDAAIIATSGNSSEPIHQASKVLRRRGRIVLVGTANINVSRDIFYHKELTFIVSCSYGPGRYDPQYELHGIDYPKSYVRWTENRNFGSLLDLMHQKKLSFEELTTNIFEFKDCKIAYQALLKSKESLGILLKYPEHVDISKTIRFQNIISNTEKHDNLIIDFIGTGNFARSVLIPNFSKLDIQFNKVLTATASKAANFGGEYGFSEVTTDENSIFENSLSNCVVVSSQHDSHAEYLLKCVTANKNIFIEKPLCINKDQFHKLEKFFLSYKKDVPIIFMGFNRRFAPLVRDVKSHLDSISHPIFIDYFINAGTIEDTHWIQDPNIGGGRLIGEACHFIDLAMFLANSSIKDYSVEFLDTKTKDSFTISLKFENGSVSNINYISFGPNDLSKENIRITYPNAFIELDNFQTLRTINTKGLKSKKLFSQDKGHFNSSKEFVDVVRKGKKTPTSLEDIFSVSKITLDLS